MQSILSLFPALGLSAQETALYIASLELGPQPASVLAKKARIKRSHAYNILSALKDKGIMHETIRNGVRHFDSRSPSSLLPMLAHQEEELAIRKRQLLEALPVLEKIRNPRLVQPKVRFFQGVEGLKEVYNDTIRVKGQPIYAICDFEHAFPESQNKELHDWMWRYTDRRAAAGVWYHGIINKSKDSDLAFKWRAKQKRKMKMLKGVHLPVELNVYGDKVALLSTSEDLVGVIIEDAPIAAMLRNVHQAMWPNLPDYKA